MVTGADGFVGTHLCRALLQKYTVYAFILPPRLAAFQKKLDLADQTHLKILIGEFKDLSQHQDELHRIQYVVHCAGTMLGARYETYEEANFKTTQLMLDYLPKHLKKLVFLSSQSALGPSDSPQNKLARSALPNPLSYYGQTKLMAEKIVLESKFPSIVLRPAPILGPEDLTFLEIFQNANKGRFPILGQKLKHFQFIHVLDLVAAIEWSLFAADKQKLYHIAHSEVATWETMKLSFEKALNRPLKTLFLNPMLTRWYLRFYDLVETVFGKKTNKSMNKWSEIMAPYWIFDETEFTIESGIAFRHSLDKTIEDTLYWYRQNLWL